MAGGAVVSRERPILFTGAMVRAILDGRKTETRRIVKPQPREGTPGRINWHSAGRAIAGADPQRLVEFAPCPYGKPGDLLWVRETWGVFDRGSVDPFEVGEVLPDPLTVEYALAYRATDEDSSVPATWVEAPLGHRVLAADERWRPSIHMPKWACRLWLRVESVRVERLQHVTNEGAVAEGATGREGFWSLDWSRIGRSSRFAPSGKLTVRDIGLTSPRLAFANAWNSIRPENPWGQDPWVWVVAFSRTEAPR